MTTRAATAFVALVTSAAWAVPCTAREAAVPGPDNDTWGRWVEQALEKEREAFKLAADSDSRNAGRAVSEARRASYVAVREPALGQETAASSMERLTAALKTDVEDAEAGVSVAPFLLFGSDSQPSRPLDSLSFQLAALKENKTRIGAKWAWTDTTVPDSLGSIGLKPCEFDDEKARRALEILRSHFNAACEVLLTSVVNEPSDEEEARTWRIARRACGVTGEGEPPSNLTLAREALKTAIEQVRPVATADQLSAIGRIAGSLAWVDFLGEHGLPLATGCYSPKALKVAARQHEWSRFKLKLGLLSAAEFFPRKSGFNTDESKPLPKGEVALQLVQAEASVEKGRFSVAGSLAVAEARAKFDEKMYTSVRPALSGSFALARLGGGSLTDSQGQIRLLEDGSLPPMLILGFLAKLDYAKTRPESQTSNLNAAEYQVFLDFRITEKLSFRVGAPYKGEVVTREKNDKVTPVVPEKRDMQWSVPVFVATVFKL